MADVANAKDLKLAIDGKDRDFFMERELPFPLFWYGCEDLPPKLRKSRAYSVEMRELSDLTMDEIAIVEMFWGLSNYNQKLLTEQNREFIENIPVPTPTRINALVQIKLSLINSDERKEWADRVEGKSVSREVSMSLTTNDDDSTTSATRELIMSKFNELGEAWSKYGQTSEDKGLPHEETKLLEMSEDGEAQG